MITNDSGDIIYVFLIKSIVVGLSLVMRNLRGLAMSSRHRNKQHKGNSGSAHPVKLAAPNTTGRMHGMLCLHLSRAKSPKQIKYTLQEATSHSYLGVEITNNLKGGNHVNTVANKAVGFIRRRRSLYSCPQDLKSTAYQTIVRPLIEYSSTFWDPPPWNRRKKWQEAECATKNM